MPSFFDGMRDDEAGDELWTIMEGADGFDSGFLGCERRELPRERDRESNEGGGDLSLGEIGQCDVFSPDVVPDAGFCGRGTFEGSCTEIG